MPERNLVSLPDDMSYAHAALTEPVATAMHAVLEGERLSRKPMADSRVLVLGGGAIGISVALILYSHGCRNICLGETNSTAPTDGGANRLPVKFMTRSMIRHPEADSWDVVIDAVGGASLRAKRHRRQSNPVES